MRFARPDFIMLIFITSCVIGFYIWAFKSRRAARERFAQKDLLKELLSRVNIKRQTLKTVFLASAVFLCLVALLRPQWGFKWQEVRRRGIDILIALDTSKSMLASDVKPSRLERAKLALGDFVGRLGRDRVGLIAFAGTAFLECPLTADYGGFLLTLENIDTDAIPRGGTSISSAIKEAMRSFPSARKKDKVLVIITDGEDHEGNPLRVAVEAAKEGIIIFCVGIGTREGELILVEQEGGSREFLKDSAGNVVKSRLDEETLQKIALATGGAYVRSTSAEFGLDLLYKEKLFAMQKSESVGRMNKLYQERFQIPLAIALLLILMEMLISDAKTQ